MPDHPEHQTDGKTVRIWLHCQELKIPPIHDALVLGKKAAIGSEAMRRALTLLHVSPFEHIELKGEHEDDVVSDILVRQSVFNKVSRDRLINYLLGRVKSFMSPDEILHLRIEAEVSVEDQI